jgi:hypothetical protein
LGDKKTWNYKHSSLIKDFVKSISSFINISN